MHGNHIQKKKTRKRNKQKKKNWKKMKILSINRLPFIYTHRLIVSGRMLFLSLQSKYISI